LTLLSHYFGLKPWDVGRLTVVEFETYVAQADHWQTQAGRE